MEETTTYLRCIDENGKISIPVALRKSEKLKEGMILGLSAEEKSIFLYAKPDVNATTIKIDKDFCVKIPRKYREMVGAEDGTGFLINTRNGILQLKKKGETSDDI